MNIYRISQNAVKNYDTFDAAIVVAKDEDEARRLHPAATNKDAYEALNPVYWISTTWATHPAQVRVEYIGRADASFTEPRVILASFQAG